MHILYVEDNQTDTDLTRRHFARHAPQITLEHARTYGEAITKLAASSQDHAIYDLVLTDMRLPDGDGLKVLSHIRRNALPIPVIVLTGMGSEEMAVSALKGGAEDYITKRHDYLTRLPTLLENTLMRFRATISRHSRPLRVLYAEHHALDIDLTRRHLARYAPHIHLAVVNTAAEVLHHLANQARAADFDLLLLDYRLPGMNALDLLKELEYRHLSKVPVVLVTGQGDEEVAVQALRLGITDYLVKNPGYLFQLPRTLENTHTQILLQRERDALFESEQRYRENQRRLAQLVEHVDEVIWLRETQGQNLLYISPAYTQIWGRTVASVYEEPDSMSTAIVVEDEEMAVRFRKALHQGYRADLEFRIQRSNGSIAWVAVQTFPIEDEQGQVYRVAGLARDITERRRSEERLQQQERLVAVGQMAAGIAHDFNNILAIIILYTQMLQIAIQQSVHQRHLATIYQQAMHAANLVQQILDFSRRSPMARVPMDIVPFIKEMVKLWQRTLPENIRVELEITTPLLVMSVDPSRLQQALMNVAFNARDAMPDGGILRVSVSPMTLLPGQHPPFARMNAGNWLCIGISDSGTGIPPDILPHIFDPFFTTKAPGAGTGLGLAQVYGIIHLLDGFIQVESQVGLGTLFTIYFPLVDQPITVADESQSLPARGQGETILLVEDQAALREAMAEMLMQLGYQVLSAENGRHAIYLFGENRAHIAMVISDLVMPDMGGQELYQELVREYSSAGPLRMLLVTGYPQESLLNGRTDEGIIKWLQKPFAMDTFAHRVADTLREEFVRVDSHNS